MGGTIEAGRARGLARVLAALMAAAALIPLGSGGYILAKAQVAQWLLTSAWDRTLAGETQVRPWSWADTWPVARLDLGPKGGSVLVLAGASGRTLAFGPGHLGSTPLPGAGGNSAFAGHRDTHFAALADLAPGDRLRVEIPGRTLGYRITETRVVDQAEVGVLADRGHEALTLITCYPFDALIPGGPLRFVVFAESRVLRDLRLPGPFSLSGNPQTFGMGLRTPSRLEPRRGKSHLWERRPRRDGTWRKGI